MNTRYLESARDVIDKEIMALEQLKLTLGDGFVKTVDVIYSSNGKVVVTGVGKSGHIGRKIAATLSSLGTPAFFLHPNDAMHGDLGMITKEDVVFAISNSGESDELLRIIPNIKLIGATLIAVSNNSTSNLAKHADIFCPIPKVDEACHINMAPTSSTTVTIALGDALAIVLSDLHQFKKDNFAKFHPAGVLGKRLTTKVSDIMHTDSENAVVHIGSSVKTALFEIAKKGFGSTIVIDSSNVLVGFITDGDIRRAMEKEINITTTLVDEIMTKIPVTISEEALAVDALMMMQQGGRRLSSLPVVNKENNPVGMLTSSDILKLGIVY